MRTAKSIAPPSLTTATRKSIAPMGPAPTAAQLAEYMPLVHQVVARFLRKLPPNVLRDDLVAAGSFGLLDALRKGEGAGPTFEWYARIRIRGAILDELRSQDWLTRRARNKVTASAASAGEGEPTFRATVVGFDDLPEAQAHAFADESVQSPLVIVEERASRKALSDAVARLPERECNIVTWHYFQGVSFKAIADRLGVSEPRVSQLHSRAMQLLKVAIARAAAEEAAA